MINPDNIFVNAKDWKAIVTEANKTVTLTDPISALTQTIEDCYHTQEPKKETKEEYLARGKEAIACTAEKIFLQLIMGQASNLTNLNENRKNIIATAFRLAEDFEGTVWEKYYGVNE